MEKYFKLKKFIENLDDDMVKFYMKEQKAAGVRLRKDMQEIRKLAKEIRDEIQEVKNKRQS